jgi:hypothetical protein
MQSKNQSKKNGSNSQQKQEKEINMKQQQD